jgi:hypothetical protein
LGTNGFYPNADDSSGQTSAKKPGLVGLFGNTTTQDPGPTPQEKPGKIRDLSTRLLLSVASTPPAQGPHVLKPAYSGLPCCFCLRRSTLIRRRTPLAPLETWRVASPTPRLNTKAGFINSMSYSLPKYCFQDIPAYLTDEIITGMIEGKTEPTPEEMGSGLLPIWNAKPKCSLHSILDYQRAGQTPALFLFAQKWSELIAARPCLHHDSNFDCGTAPPSSSHRQRAIASSFGDCGPCGTRPDRMAPPPVPRYRCHSLAPRGDRCENRARMARPRVACDDAEIPRTLEGNREAARSHETAVLNQDG